MSSHGSPWYSSGNQSPITPNDLPPTIYEHNQRASFYAHSRPLSSDGLWSTSCCEYDPQNAAPVMAMDASFPSPCVSSVEHMGDYVPSPHFSDASSSAEMYTSPVYGMASTLDLPSYRSGFTPMTLASQHHASHLRHLRVTPDGLLSARHPQLHDPRWIAPAAPTSYPAENRSLLPPDARLLVTQLPARVEQPRVLHHSSTFALPPFQEHLFPEVDHSRHTSPELCYAQLLGKCLLSAPNHTMSLREIYLWMGKNTQKARDQADAGWKNSIRHNLSMNEAFEKVVQPKRGSLWRLTPKAAQEGVVSTTRFRRDIQRRRQQHRGVPAPKHQRSGAKGGLATREALRYRQALLNGRSSNSSNITTARHPLRPPSTADEQSSPNNLPPDGPYPPGPSPSAPFALESPYFSSPASASQHLSTLPPSDPYLPLPSHPYTPPTPHPPAPSTACIQLSTPPPPPPPPSTLALEPFDFNAFNPTNPRSPTVGAIPVPEPGPTTTNDPFPPHTPGPAPGITAHEDLHDHPLWSGLLAPDSPFGAEEWARACGWQT